MNFIKIKKNIGFSLVEVIMTASIISISTIAILNAYGYFVRTLSANPKSIKATYLLEEGIESMRFLRDKSWSSNISNLTLNTNYYLYPLISTTTMTWQTTTTRQLVDNYYTRTIQLSAVYRNNSTKNIAQSGTLDTDAKKVTVSVSWLGVGGSTTTKSMSSYVFNLSKN